MIVGVISCPHGHTTRTSYAAELGRSWVEAVLRRHCGKAGWVGVTPMGSVVRKAHQPGDGACQVCGDVRLTFEVLENEAEVPATD